MDMFETLITEICAEEQIDCQILSHGWIYRLTKNGKARHIVGRHFDVNPAAADMIACDKYACCTLLNNSGVPVIEHKLLFNPLSRSAWIEDTGEWANALAYFYACGQRVVVKPNDGWQGRDVYLCETPKALERAVQTIFKSEPNVCLCPFYDIRHEYRVFYVAGKCLFTYGKERAHVTGDGIRNLRELVAACGIPSDCWRCTYEPEYIPHREEQVCVSWKHNLSNGAAAFVIEDKALLSKLHALAVRAAQCINIQFATVDIAQIHEGAAGSRLAVMEINAGVTVKKLLEQHPNRRDDAKRIYGEAIRAMFTDIYRHA